jgi:hypothetical protein
MLEGLRPDNTKPIAAIVSLPQTNIEISGNMCSGFFSENDYADYSGYWFGFNNSFRGFGFNLEQTLFGMECILALAKADRFFPINYCSFSAVKSNQIKSC